MQMSQPPTRALLTALEVQDLLHVDRSTVYRMAEDGRLPAIRVGRSWRFPADRIEALLAATAAPEEPAPPSLTIVPPGTAAPAPEAPDDDGVAEFPGPISSQAARAAVAVAAELLGVMMVVTDMHGRPITPVANPCSRFAERAGEPAVLDACIAEWRDLADHPDLSPCFQSGSLGFECARAFVRSGSTLVGMVLAGGISTSTDERSDPDLHHLDEAGRARVLAALPRIAAAICPPASRPATPSNPATNPAAMKENL